MSQLHTDSDNHNQKIAFVCSSKTVKNTHGRWTDGRREGRTSWPHLDLLLQEVDFVLLLQKLLLLPGNLRTEHTMHKYYMMYTVCNR